MTPSERVISDKSASSFAWGQTLENIIWIRFLFFLSVHVGFFASLIMYVFRLHPVPIKPLTIAWIFVIVAITLVGITAGAHRLWSHRSYKAKLPLRILLMILYSVHGLYTLYDWAKDHRVHHKYSDTNADPHNAQRGFFFSHIGWLFLKRNPECLLRGREVDVADIRADAVVMFEKKYTIPMRLIFCYGIPTAIPVVFWGETILHAAITQCILRHVMVLHLIFCVNSVAHLWGDRPYNRLINPAENLVLCFFSGGEGSHNYHHTFPWDYKASEFPYVNFNLTTLFIETMAKLGWAYDLREPSRELVDKVVQRLGRKSFKRENNGL